MYFQDQLLVTKYMKPILSQPIMTRQRLTALLEDSMLHTRLTLLCAPAGYGKTTLLAAWLQSLQKQTTHSTPIHVAWLSLDECDNETNVICHYIIAALDNCQPGLFKNILTYIDEHKEPSSRYVLSLLINMLAAQPEHFILVLDDYHLIHNQDVHDAITFLLERLPSQFHIILATRTMPQLPLARWRVHRQLIEIYREQLACTPEEAMHFLTMVMKLNMTSHEVEKLTQHTEGWIAGLQLAALSLRHHPNSEELLKTLKGNQRAVLDYLTDDVLRQQSDETQRFLLCTSILEQMNASLCDALIGRTGSQKILEELERDSIFLVPLDNQQRWYRYHHLFAEALRYQLERTPGKDIHALHYRASVWYAEHNDLTQAVRHAFQSQNWPWAAELLEKLPYENILLEQNRTRWRYWFNVLPREEIRARPQLYLTYAHTLLWTSSWSELKQFMENTEPTFMTLLSQQSAQANTEENISAERQQLRCNAMALRALIAAYQGNGAATRLFYQQALTYASTLAPLTRSELSYALGLVLSASGDVEAAYEYLLRANTLAQTANIPSLVFLYSNTAAYQLLLQGRLHEAWDLLQQTCESNTQFGEREAPPELYWTYIYKAQILCEWNQLDEALELATKAQNMAELTEYKTVAFAGYSLLMRIALEQGNLDKARSALLHARRRRTPFYVEPTYTTQTMVEHMRLWLQQGKLKLATQWATELNQRERHPSALTNEREDMTRTHILLASEEPVQALSIIQPAMAKAEIQRRWYNVIEWLLLQARAYQLMHAIQEALATLQRALTLAESECFIRIFVDHGAPLQSLLEQLRTQMRGRGETTTYINTLISAFSSESSSSAHTHAPITIRPSQERKILEGTHEHIQTRQTVGNVAIAQQPLIDPLSARELEVLYLLATGRSNAEIAHDLVITVNTVKRHVGHIFEKLGAANRTQAQARARELGLI
ncbi:MAG TPA: LuxR C-terminal-related transcriptional regulator [Dictyobacter sp.]|jgi:LuxR family maltose regulon positive regulatory protein|nr:LuxR C-terminal-related transcriptional regulator [Dictyobacter sp.]